MAKLDGTFIVFTICFIVAVICGGILVQIGLSSHSVNGTVTNLDNSWQADGYTYSNFTVSVHGHNEYVTVQCNYYHVNSTISYNYGNFLWTYILSSPMLVRGC
jgi:hypothetical protein